MLQIHNSLTGRKEGITPQEMARQAFFMSHETYTPARGGSVFCTRSVTTTRRRVRPARWKAWKHGCWRSWGSPTRTPAATGPAESAPRSAAP